MGENELLKKLEEKCPDKKMTCSDARTWADEQDISYEKLGALLDAAGIKVTKCALGCF
ncbi:MAG: hypothetical protein Q4B48_01905 [Syntrophomonadaceae bacterium]|nr:hypothetical protein [Syntrophomonadaceae bacterium]